jgi:hypothetical protein
VTTDFISGYVRQNVRAGEPRSIDFKKKNGYLSNSSKCWFVDNTRQCKY